jgi:tRNA wybutosine-synthesizing protein 2
MTKLYQKLVDNLDGKIPASKLDGLPHRYQIIGDVFLFKLLNPGMYRYRKKIGKAVIEIFPYIRSVLLVKGVKTKKRVPDTEHVAGSKNTLTIHTEHGIKYCFDPRKIMFSKGNNFEKLCLLKKICKSDTVVDMFAGIGYWSLVVAKKSKKVYSIDVNSDSIESLEKNCFLNNIDNIEILEGDCRKYSGLLSDTANKVIMGYFGTKKFFSDGLDIVKSGGIIFYHDLVAVDSVSKLKSELVGIAKKKGIVIKFLSTRKVKSYKPGFSHHVFYVRVKKY